MGKITIIQNLAVESAELIETVLLEHGHSLSIIRTFNHEEVDHGSGGIDGLVVMGGPMSVSQTDKHPFLSDIIRLMDACLKNQVPILGICLGSQLLAHTLGSAITQAPGKEIGWHKVRLTESAQSDSLFRGLEGSFTPLHWHGDEFELPAGAIHLASSMQTGCQAFRYGTNAWGILFHMEVTAESLKGWVKVFARELAEAGLTSEELLNSANFHLPHTSPIGSTVFSRWAQLLEPGIKT